MNQLTDIEERLNSTLDNLNNSNQSNNNLRKSKRIKNKNNQNELEDNNKTEDEMLQQAIKNSLQDMEIPIYNRNDDISINDDISPRNSVSPCNSISSSISLSSDEINNFELESYNSNQNNTSNYGNERSSNSNLSFNSNLNEASIMINNKFKFRTLPISDLPVEFYSIFNNNNFSSDKIIIPDSIMQILFNSNLNQENTDNIHVLKVSNKKNNLYKFGTIGEFIPGDVAYLPELMYYGLELNSLNECTFEIIFDVKKAKKVILQPEQFEFLNIKDQQKLLLNEFNKNFRLLMNKQQIIINSNELNQEISFTVDKLFDNLEEEIEIGKIIDVDLEVEFDIREEFQKRYESEMKEKIEAARKKKEEEDLKKRSQFNPRSVRFYRPSNSEIKENEPKAENINSSQEPFQGKGRILGSESKNKYTNKGQINSSIQSSIVNLNNLISPKDNNNSDSNNKNNLTCEQLREIRLKRFCNK